ncbi:interferon-induced very large GTPase 1-like [Mytilus trossulus]|uniref:interferon-induced very large GTPase 1-like n=1 Tax=Mytilus trossulus TaxID=6551 RepID=UPI003006A607
MESDWMYARCSIVVVKVFSKMMQEILEKSSIQPEQLYQIIMRTQKFKTRLKSSEMIAIQTLQTDGYSKLDVSLVYKIAKFFNLIPPPLRKWGSKPLPLETEIGDDVERIRIGRNNFVHRVTCEMTNAEMSAFFDEFIQVAERVDSYLGKPYGTGHKDAIIQCQTCSYDSEMERSSKAAQDIESLKEKIRLTVENKVIHVLYGHSFKELIDEVQKEECSSTSAVTFIVKGVKDSQEKTELLNSLKDQINSGSVCIEFKQARNGSILVFASIKTSVLKNENCFIKEVAEFVQRIFKLGKLATSTENACNIIIVPDEEPTEDLEDSSDDERSEVGDIILDLEVSNEVLKTDESFKQHFGGFATKMMNLTNGKDKMENSDHVAILYPCQKGISTSVEEHGLDTQNQTNISKSLIETHEKLQEGNCVDSSARLTQAQSPRIPCTKSDDIREENGKRNENVSLGIKFEDDTKDVNVEDSLLMVQIQGDDDSNTDFQRFIKEIGLENYFPSKIDLMDVMQIKETKTLLSYTDIPWLVLKQIIMINYTARDKMVQEWLEKIPQKTKSHNQGLQYDEFLDDLFHNIEHQHDLNPLDLFVALFQCCSTIFKQILAEKMFVCKLAVPICFPPQTNKNLHFSTWTLRSIVVDCITDTKATVQSSVMDCPCHVIGFLRLGEINVSKSKLINDVLSDQYHNTFFNKDCPLGTVRRRISEGLIEGAWYIPSERSRFFDNVTMFLNLRGNSQKHYKQLELIAKLSSVVIVITDIRKLQIKETKEVLLQIHKSNVGVILAIEANNTDTETAANIYKAYKHETRHYQSKTSFCMLSKDGTITSSSDVRKAIRQKIFELLRNTRHIPLLNRLNEISSQSVVSTTPFIDLERKAKEILDCIPAEVDKFKDIIVPLQGKTWQKWSNHCKTLNKTTLYTSLQEGDQIKQAMNKQRAIQSNICENLGQFMHIFVATLLHTLDVDHAFILFIRWLKLLLDDRSRNVIPKHLARYQREWQSFRSVKNTKDHERIDQIKHQLNESEYELAEASFGFEHLIREVGQMYEAIIEGKSKSRGICELAEKLPVIGAKLLLTGHPFELMDGDVANVPLTWVKAVLNQLKEIIGDKKLLALSVLGVQSSGKSTFLNTMFGLQFAVSAGRCTRGVFMQLVPVITSERLFDFVVVIDTEGLRAPELAYQKYSHDNELATFVIGLGDITIVNIKGENTAEVKDVLQIAVHAFLRLKLANERLNLKQKCIFIHQNVPACDANDKMMQGRQKFLETLDEMTKEAAEQEKIADIKSFSQVIDFDCEKDVWYISDLWSGDPPMSPANQGYSRRVAEVKHAILHDLASTRETYLTITDTILRIDDLWKGILKDDFVFSFRNSLELKAYNNMERKYQALTWKLEKFVSEFGLLQAKGELLYCVNEQDLANAVPRIMKLLSQEVSKQFNVLINELDTFVESSSLKDVMIQWKQNKHNRLKMLSDELIDRSKADIMKTKEEIRIEKLKVSEQKRHEMEVNELAHQLAIEMRGQKPSNDVLKHKFEQMWKSWITKFETEPTENEISIKDQIDSLQLEKFRSDAAFMEGQSGDRISVMHIDEYISIKDEIAAMLSMKFEGWIPSYVVELSDQESQIYHNLKSLIGTVEKNDIQRNHFSIKRSFYGIGWQLEDIVVCRSQIIEVTNKLLEKIDSRLDQLKTMEVKFRIHYADEILDIIVHHIEDHNRHLTNTYKFDLLLPYMKMIIIHVFRYLVIWFTHANVRFNKTKSIETSIKHPVGNEIEDTPTQKMHLSPDVHTNTSNRRTVQYQKMKKLEGTITSSQISSNHISIIKKLKDCSWGTQNDYRRMAVQVTNKIFRKIDTRLAEYSTQDVRFEISYATEILMIISDEIEEHNEHRNNDYPFNLLSTYRAMVVTHVTSYITYFFIRLNDSYVKKHSPKAQMEVYKGTVWCIFMNVFESKTENVIAALFFKDAVTKTTIDHVADLLSIDVQEHVMTSFSHEKYSLMKSIMVDLAQLESFEHYIRFIMDPSEYARFWLTKHMNETIFERNHDKHSTYGNLAKRHIQKLLTQLEECVAKATRQCKQNKEESISKWLHLFIHNTRENNVIPFPNDTFIHVQSQNVPDIQNFTEIIARDLNDVRQETFEHFNNVTNNTIQWKETPVTKIMNKLWGCTSKCMFCAEPCRNTDKDHVQQGFKHKCIQHRPQGIGGFRNLNNQTLVVEFCNFLVSSKDSFKFDDKEHLKPYKQYKRYFPDWDISPTSDTSKYWMWVMFRFQHELMLHHVAKLPDMPKSWRRITKEEAINSLSNNYS